MLRYLLLNQWVHFRRGKFFKLRIILKIFQVFIWVNIFCMVNFFGWFIDDIIMNIWKNRDPEWMIPQLISFVFLFLYLTRLLLPKRLNTASLAYMHLPISRYTLVLWHLIMNLLNPFLIFSAVFITIIGIKTVLLYMGWLIFGLWWIEMILYLTSLELFFIMLKQYYMRIT